MSTRANIIIKDASSELIFYRHSDGYPSVTGPSLTEFIQGYVTGKFRLDAMQSAGWLVIQGYEEYKEFREGRSGYGWKVGAYEPTGALHGDVEYIYVIDLETATLEILVPMRNFWDKPSIDNTVSRHKFDFNDLASVQFRDLDT